LAITGDHNFWGVFNYTKEQYAAIDAVPLYIYVPDALKPYRIDKKAYGSHLDIMPTLYALSLSQKPFYAMGSNLFDPKRNDIAYNADGFVFDPSGAVKYEMAAQTVQCLGWDKMRTDLLVDSPETVSHQSMLRLYKAAVAVADYVLKHKDIK
jgi:arylsulfatase A-like enzyme